MAGTTKFIRLMQEYTNWKQSGSSIIGQKDGYWFTIAQTGMMQPIILSAAVARLQSESLDQLITSILAKKNDYRISQYKNKGHILNFTITPDMTAAKSINRVDELIRDLSAKFKQYGLETGCGICAANTPLDAYRIGDHAAAICKDCQTKLKQDFDQIIERNAFQGTYFTGLIGALLGSLLGSAIWLLVSYLGFYASIVGFVMAFLAQAGYRLFKGRIQKGMPIIVLLAVIIGIFAANTAEIALSLMRDPDIGLSLAESLRFAPQAFYNSELFYVEKIWANTGIGLLFALLGSWPTLKNLSAETRGRIYQIEEIQ